MKTIPQIERQVPRESLLGNWWSRLRSALGSVSIQCRPRQLRLCESLSLGEKRLVAVIEYEGRRFLLAATPENVTLLQSLGTARPEDDPSERQL